MVETKSSDTSLIRRREVLNAARSYSPLLLATQIALPAPAQHRGPLIVVGGGNAVVDTAYGKVRGYIENGINTFKGIPYGDSTAGQSRFAPPQRPNPWTGIRDSMQ